MKWPSEDYPRTRTLSDEFVSLGIALVRGTFSQIANAIFKIKPLKVEITTNKLRLQQVQNFAARLLSGKKKYEHITPALKELRLLPVSDVFRYRDAVQMFKCMNNQAPTYLKIMFDKRSQIHDYNTRNSNDINLVKCRTTLAQNSFYYRGAVVWNSLPPEIRNLSNLNTFKRNLRNYFLSSWLS